LQVTTTEGAADTVIATATQLAVDADDEFIATVLGPVITITNAYPGTRDDASAGTTGWAAPVVVQGIAATAIHMKSKGTSRVLIGVAPI
jgi:hypothetical protein